MRVGVAGLVAAVVLSASAGAGVSYLIWGEDETRQELEEAFEAAEGAIEEDAEPEARPGVSAEARAAVEAEYEALPPETANAVCEAAASGGEPAVEVALAGAGVSSPSTLAAWVDWCLY